MQIIQKKPRVLLLGLTRTYVLNVGGTTIHSEFRLKLGFILLGFKK